MADDMKNHSSLQCREGDLAVIMFDERGCENNIGRIVKVIGSPRTDKKSGICWLITPEYDNTWQVLTNGCVKSDVRPFKMIIEHPDSWMIPLRDERPEVKELDEATT